MIRLICGKLLQVSRRTSPFPFSNSFFLYRTPFKFITSRFNSEALESLTVSYLQKSCGLSLESAISASKKLKVDANAKNPDLVLNLLRKHGLSDAHIKNLITSRPVILLADTDKTLKVNLEVFKSLGISGVALAKMLAKESRVLQVDAKTTVEFLRENGFTDEQIIALTMKRPQLYLYHAHKTFKPKLEFLKSLGFSEIEVAQILSTEPYILQRSLENQIIPCVQMIRRFVGDDTDVRKAIKASYKILEFNNVEVLEPNISLLQKHGVPETLILKVFLTKPKSLLLNTDELGEIIGKVKKMGFDPGNLLFVLAIRTMAVSNKALWERKLEAYRSFGLSNDEIHSAFKMQPLCMVCSVNKIRKSLNFFVNKLNLTPLMISKNPNLMLLSLEQRILPRCSVVNILMSQGLIKEGFSLIRMLTMTKNVFLEKVVTKYRDIVPEIVEAHQGRIEFQGFSKAL